MTHANDPDATMMSPGETVILMQRLTANGARWRNVVLYGDLPAGALRRLAVHSHESIRALVAKRPVVPEDVLLALAGDSVAAVRYAVVYRPNLSTAVRCRLAEDPVEDIRSRFARSPSSRPNTASG